MQTQTIKSHFIKAFLLMLALSLVLSIQAPLNAGGLTTDTTTAKSNETSSNNVLGGVDTRVTWEAVTEPGDAVKAIHLQLPEGSGFGVDPTIKVTLLRGTERMKDMAEATVNQDSASYDIVFNEPVEDGMRIRAELYKVQLPNVDGEVSLTSTYTDSKGAVKDMGASPAITVASASPERRMADWLGDQPWVQAWNSVTFLKLFLDPTIAVQSIPTVAVGWLLSLMLVLIGFPLAIPIGLGAAFMKISNGRGSRILHGIAAVYTGVVRGTPLFLQIYLAFFGMPLLGVQINEYVLAILVLAVNSGAYLCEIFRAGIQSIPKGQFEASRSLGMNARQTMFSVIIPQTVRRVIPTMTSEFILLYKDTSLLAAVGVMELMLYSKSIVSTTGNMTPYIVAACFYLVVTLPLIRVVTILEKRLASSDGGMQANTEKKKRTKGKVALPSVAETAAAAGYGDVGMTAASSSGQYVPRVATSTASGEFTKEKADAKYGGQASGTEGGRDE